MADGAWLRPKPGTPALGIEVSISPRSTKIDQEHFDARFGFFLGAP